jgi:hypothetical protein
LFKNRLGFRLDYRLGLELGNGLGLKLGNRLGFKLGNRFKLGYKFGNRLGDRFRNYGSGFCELNLRRFFGYGSGFFGLCERLADELNLGLDLRLGGQQTVFRFFNRLFGFCLESK